MIVEFDMDQEIVETPPDKGPQASREKRRPRLEPRLEIVPREDIEDFSRPERPRRR